MCPFSGLFSCLLGGLTEAAVLCCPALVSAVSVAVEAILAQFSSSRTVVQKVRHYVKFSLFLTIRFYSDHHHNSFLELLEPCVQIVVFNC